MSSPQPWVNSSPFPTAAKSKSRFTYKHLNLLAQSSTSSPLRCIALIDLDAFYAQCEMVRLGIPETQPLAVQQWQGLIALSYSARKFGLTRHVTITEAKQKCPELICQHVATWREGDDKWAYRDDSAQHIASDKVSLDPYRLQSRRILALVKEVLPASPIQRVEKASVDEMFLDLSAQIHATLLERYPYLRYAPYDDPSEFMPKAPTSSLDWATDGLIDLNDGQTEADDPDWDDVAMSIGAEIVRDVRRAVHDRLHYTCSAGIAKNKTMAKLGAGFKKPNQQTVIRNRAVQHFLSGFKFTKIRNLGGKLGEQIVSAFGTDEVEELLKVPLERLKAKFGPDTGTWIYDICRGEDTSEVNPRTQIKSMLSAKSFRPSINSHEQAIKWLRIFTADIYARLVEEGVVENKRRPKTMNLHHRQGGQMRSKQTPIPQGRKIDQGLLLGLAQQLLQQIVIDGRAWPCANLSLQVAGFEDGVAGTRDIGGFFLRKDETNALDTPSRSETATPVEDEIGDDRPTKRPRLHAHSSLASEYCETDDREVDVDALYAPIAEETGKPDLPSRTEPEVRSPEESADAFRCADCNKDILIKDRDEHQDWHFAKSLQARDTVSLTGPSNSRPPGNGAAPSRKSGSKVKGRPPSTEKGQTRITFK